MRRILLALTASVFMLFTIGAPARDAGQNPDEKRTALVIGNNAYKSVPQLSRAANDARAMAAALKKVGFATTLLTDATRRQMNRAINDFADRIAGGGVGVMFFAGHGVQIDNQNFLLPVEIEEPQRDTDVQDQAISLQVIQEKLAQARARFALMVIDACRDNPLPRKAGRGIGGTRGLSQPSAPNGQMIIFSAGANETALDSLSPGDPDPNGLFTREFLPVLDQAGLSVSDALKAVKKSVIAKAGSVNHDQHPAIYDQTDGDFYLVPPAPNAGPATKAEPDHAPPAGSKGVSAEAVAVNADEEEALWARIKDSRRIADFDIYLERFPKGRYVDAARMAMHGGAWVADAGSGCRLWDPFPQDGETVTWSGGCVNGRAEGDGTSEWIRGNTKIVIEEVLKGGRFDGKHAEKRYRDGRLFVSTDGSASVMADGKTRFNGRKVHEPGGDKDQVASEDGVFVDGQLVDGTVTFKNGSVMRCQLAEGRGLTGICHFKAKDGYTYDGEYKDGKRTGHAKIRYADSELYEGEVKEGFPDGYGKWENAKGDTYEGDFRAGKRNGKGVYVWKTGCRYVGEFVAEKQHGQGLLICPNGLRQDGRFIAGVYSGK